MNLEKAPNLFDKYGLEVTSGDVAVGETYPIYGMITKIEESEDGQVIAELNFSIRAYMTIPDEAKVELLKERAFEPGIFISTVLDKHDSITVDCQTVVFGKKQNYSA